jgi:putative endonuclease
MYEREVEMAYVYILRCADGSYYTGCTTKPIEGRVAEHNVGIGDGYTKLRRPVALVWHLELGHVRDAVERERQIKGWSRRKKEALIAGDMERLKQADKRKQV